MTNPMVFGLDVGNTHTKIGLLQGSKVVDVFRFRTERDKAVDEYYFQLKGICQELNLEKIPPLWVASVVPAVSIALERLADTRKLELHCINNQTQFNFKIHPKIVQEIGSDILVLAEAATRLVGENVIIVSAGTASVVFVVHNNILLGGAIAPGIKGSVESLISQAALLKAVFFTSPDTAIGQNTEAAMTSGTIYGFAGLLDGLVLRMKEELNLPDIPVIATGGMIGKVGKASRTIQQIYQDLGMQGIAFLAERLRVKAL